MQQTTDNQKRLFFLLYSLFYSFFRVNTSLLYIFILTATFAAKAAPATIVSLLFDAYVCVCVHYALYLSYHAITNGVNGSILLYSVLL